MVVRLFCFALNLLTGHMKKSLAGPIAIFLLILWNLTATICFSMQDIKRERSANPSTTTRPARKTENRIENGNVEMKIRTVKRSFFYPKPIQLQVFLFKPYPVSGASVEGTIHSPSGNTFEVRFHENILIGATTPESGSYVAIITDIEEDGRYLIKIRANDNHGSAHFSRSSKGEKRSSCVGPFEIERLINIQATGYEGMPQLPPLKITTLYAEVEDQCIILSWQVPLNIGRNGNYEIRYSHERIDSRKAWEAAKVLFQGKYHQKGGDMQSYRSCNLGEGKYHFAVISKNKTGGESQISNNYIIVLQ